MQWSHEQVGQWHLIRKAYLEDVVAVKRDQETDLKRSQARLEMVRLLNSFLAETVTLRKFNAIFQHKTHTTWSIFGLRGMSGGLFLNKLVKHVPSEEILTNQLRTALRLPKDIAYSLPEDSWDGRKSMDGFIQFLEGLIASQQVLRSQLQPARVPFFLSGWWHLQASEQWPVFYLHVRSAFMTEGTTLQRLQDPVEAYFEFRSRFIFLAKELEVTPWQLEHMCAWYAQHRAGKYLPAKQKDLWIPETSLRPGPTLQQKQSSTSHPQAKNKNLRVARDKMDAAQKEKNPSPSRAQLLWTLARIGIKVGYQVWIAQGDHNILWNNERLGTLSLETLPSLGNALVQALVKQVDVVWLQKNTIVAVYEVELAPKNISTDLLCLCDLRALLPRREVHLCLVAPHMYYEKVQFELSRPTFHKNERLKDLAIISSEMLVQHQEHILRWASSPSVIHDLISYLNNAGES